MKLFIATALCPEWTTAISFVLCARTGIAHCMNACLAEKNNASSSIKKLELAFKISR